MDKVRYYWIIQIALSFGLAAFFFALAVFIRDLPNDSLDRFLSPMIQVPAITAFIGSYRILIWHKRTYGGDDLMLPYFLWGVSLLSISIVAALLVALSKY